MSSLSSSTSSTFDKLLDKATNQVDRNPDRETILQICDSIRRRDITAKNAVMAINKKIHDNNPKVVYLALVVLEECAKNCGSVIHNEITNKAFLESIRLHLKKIAPEKVKDNNLDSVHVWSDSSSCMSFQDTYNIEKMKGYSLPPVNEMSKMFTPTIEWSDGEVCNKCHVNFGLIQRKHHCRNCGQVFCGQCSSKKLRIPQLGYVRKVRVCNHCYNQLKSKTTHSTDKAPSAPQSSNDLPAEYLNSSLYKESQTPAQPRNDTELRLQEEDDLQLALAMSLNEIENRNHLQASSSIALSSQSIPLPKYLQDDGTYKNVSSASAPTATKPELELDPKLARHLDNSYWENQKERNESKTTESKLKNTTSAKSTAVNTVSVKSAVEENGASINQEVKVPGSNYGLEIDKDMVFLQAFTSSLQLFKERMEKACVESRSIVIDASIQSLFQSLTAMHPQLLKISDETALWKAEYLSIMLKLKKVEDARIYLSERRAQYQASFRQQGRMEFRGMPVEEKLALCSRQQEHYLRYQYEMEAERQRAEEHRRLQQLQFDQPMHNQYVNRFQTPFNLNLAANGDIVHGPQSQQNSLPSNPNQWPRLSSQQPFLLSNVAQVSTPQNNGNMLPQNIDQSNLPLRYGPQSAQGMQYTHSQQNVSQAFL